MFPSSHDQQGGGDLEQRLRGLILNNGAPNPSSSAAPPVNSHLPPHMLAASSSDQQAYLAARNTNANSQQASNVPGQANQPPKKRLNQAQRRQMNSNLSIPIDSRPNPAAQSGRGAHSYGGTIPSSKGSPQFGYAQPSHNQRYQQHQSYSPQFPNQGQPSPYSPRGPHPQDPPQSPYQHGGSNMHQGRQGPHMYQQQQYQPNQQQFPGFRGPDQAYGRPPSQNRQLFQPGSYNGQGRGRPFVPNPEAIQAQSTLLTVLVAERVPIVGIDAEEISEKDEFRAVVEQACRESISQYEQKELSNPNFDASTVELRCFGSMSSGFATKASDMDLALLTPLSHPPADSSESPIPRILEKKLLTMGFGARLLTRTRVPIIKLCQKPTEKLLSDLLEARDKWEKGFVDEPEEDADVAEAKGPREELESPKDATFPDPVDSKPETITQSDISPDDQKLKLKQKENQTLGDYHNSAKRLLRKLGGRDIYASSPDLTENEGEILNDVCKAFISGLKSQDLLAQLRSYQSISHLFDPSLPPLQRTLNGVWTQIEGEQFAMAFENRPVPEAREQREAECLAALAAWRQLQDKSGSFVETLIYNRQLSAAADKLKSMSSLQLVFLKQIEFEEPTYYYTRAKRILDDLRAQVKGPAIVFSIVVAHYISGVNNRQVREELQKLAQAATLADDEQQPQTAQQIQDETRLHVVGLQHRALQIIMDYEVAVAGGIFDESDKTYVEQYIRLLRSRCLDGFTNSVDVDRALMEKLNSLPNPTNSNKPRDRYRDHLEFPKTDIGIQCDINFSADLALHNTLLLRCYSHCDPRVKLLILFVKHWAKVRGVNTPYRGSLSSYGYVLMVLHYLVNIVQPFVCPNLQSLHREPPSYLSPAEIEGRTICNGRDVRFWRNEMEIKDLSTRGLLNHNKDPVGKLLRGFFEYFAHGGQMSTFQSRGFDWGREVLSLRTTGGILSKQEKGWVGAKTVTETTTIAAPPTASIPAHPKEDAIGDDVPTEIENKPVKPKTVEETKEIRHRYLFAIEDPFELDHNVARTVTHNGIVSIRDEFRRAWGIIQKLGTGKAAEELLDPVVLEEPKGGLDELLGVKKTAPLNNGRILKAKLHLFGDIRPRHKYLKLDQPSTNTIHKMPTELEELVDFISHGNTQVRQIAVENLVPYSITSPSVFKTNQLLPIKDLKLLVRDYKQIAKNALTILINLSTDREVLANLASDKEFMKTLLERISNPAEPNANEISMLLANLAKYDELKDILHLEHPTPNELNSNNRAIDQLLDLFVKGADGTYNKEADFDYLSYLFADLAKHSEGRKYFLTKQDYDGVVPLTKLVVFTEHKSEIRRKGVASTIKNVAFEIDAHPRFLDEDEINILPYLLLPIMGNEEYDEEDSMSMLADLQLLPPDKKREPDSEIVKTHVETLMLLTTSRKGRDILREVKVYPIVRETHLQVEDEGVREACERLVQVLMRDEEGEERVDAGMKALERKPERGKVNGNGISNPSGVPKPFGRSSGGGGGWATQETEESEDEDDKIVDV